MLGWETRSPIFGWSSFDYATVARLKLLNPYVRRLPAYRVRSGRKRF